MNPKVADFWRATAGVCSIYAWRLRRLKTWSQYGTFALPPARITNRTGAQFMLAPLIRPVSHSYSVPKGRVILGASFRVCDYIS